MTDMIAAVCSQEVWMHLGSGRSEWRERLNKSRIEQVCWLWPHQRNWLWSSVVKCSQEKIEQLLVKMEWARRGRTDPCLKIPGSSVTSLQVVSCSELASAPWDSPGCAGRQWGRAKSWVPFGLPADRDALTPFVSSVTGGCEKQHWCLLLQLPDSSQCAFRRGWQNGWVLLGLWSASFSQTACSAQLGAVVPWLRFTCAWPWPSCQCISAAWINVVW